MYLVVVFFLFKICTCLDKKCYLDPCPVYACFQKLSFTSARYGISKIEYGCFTMPVYIIHLSHISTCVLLYVKNK